MDIARGMAFREFYCRLPVACVKWPQMLPFSWFPSFPSSHLLDSLPVFILHLLSLLVPLLEALASVSLVPCVWKHSNTEPLGKLSNIYAFITIHIIKLTSHINVAHILYIQKSLLLAKSMCINIYHPYSLKL